MPNKSYQIDLDDLVERLGLEALPEYLRRLSEFFAMGRTIPPSIRYSSMEGLVLDLGQPFKAAPIPRPKKLGAEGECYRNTYHLVKAAPYRWKYTEGYAYRPDIGIPILHAWGVNTRGEANDPTWEYDAGNLYYGMTFEWKDVLRFLQNPKVARGCPAILENQHLFGFPLARTGLLFPPLPTEVAHGSAPAAR
jgi:hypothetical protein